MEEREREGKQREGREKIGEGRDRERRDQSIACGKGKYCLITFVISCMCVNKLQCKMNFLLWITEVLA